MLLRVVTDAEWQQIVSTRTIAPSQGDWTPYGPGSVSFYHHDTVPAKYLLRFAADAFADGAPAVHLISVEVAPRLRGAFVKDVSSTYKECLVHHGPLSASEDVSIRRVATLTAPETDTV